MTVKTVINKEDDVIVVCPKCGNTTTRKKMYAVICNQCNTIIN